MTFEDVDHGQIYDLAGRRKYLSTAELTRFLAAADRRPLGCRAFLYLLAYAGCRLSEALAITAEQFDPERQTITFRTLKRRRRCYRTLPVPPVLADMLQHLAPPLPVRCPAEWRFWPVHRTTAWRWVKCVMDQASISGPMASPKGLRHGFGTRAAGRNVPLPLIQRWMGHARPTTTAIYLQVVDDEEREFARRTW